jgi:NAD(P)H-dependent flavin oxidoreductase YrpB (nitropropane dioxygenase family)
VAALALGAEGVVLGTRFLATPEAAAHPIYKQKVLEATEEDTVRTTLFGRGWPNAPHRTLRTAFVDEWLKDEARGSEQRVDEPVIGESIFGGERLPLQRFAGFPPTAEATGDIESMGLLAGQSVGLVTDLKPAAVIIREIVMRRCLEKSRRTFSSCGDVAFALEAVWHRGRSRFGYLGYLWGWKPCEHNCVPERSRSKIEERHSR